MERDSLLRFSVGCFFDFNSHAHVERDLCCVYGVSVAFNFNSHAHVERDENVHRHSPFAKNFNSHAHVERDMMMAHIRRQSSPISTHTLTWSVTSSNLGHSVTVYISTHTLTWSVTFCFFSCHFVPLHYFNSHAHVERD